MPIYEYRCQSCGHEMDALQKVGDDPLSECPDCGKPSLRRLISAPAFRLKGSGWYETDFKSDKEVKRNLVESPERAKSEKKTEKAGKSSEEKGSKPAGESKSGSSGPSSTSKSTGSGSAAA